MTKKKLWIITDEMTHLAVGDYDCMDEVNDEDIDCGTVAEHLKRNTCPKKNGKVGDIHLELYVQWDIIVEASNEKEAHEKHDQWLVRRNGNVLGKIDEQNGSDIEDNELDTYLTKRGITTFDSGDFNGETISCEELDISTRVKEVAGFGEIPYLDRYENNPNMKLSVQLANKKLGQTISSEMIIVHEKLYYDNGK